MNNDVQIHFNQNIVNKMILKRLKTIQELIENKEENMSKKQCNPAPPLSVPDMPSPPPPPPTRKINEKFHLFDSDPLFKMPAKKEIDFLKNELNIASDTIKELRNTQKSLHKTIQTLEGDNEKLKTNYESLQLEFKERNRLLLRNNNNYREKTNETNKEIRNLIKLKEEQNRTIQTLEEKNKELKKENENLVLDQKWKCMLLNTFSPLKRKINEDISFNNFKFRPTLNEKLSIWESELKRTKKYLKEVLAENTELKEECNELLLINNTAEEKIKSLGDKINFYIKRLEKIRQHIKIEKWNVEHQIQENIRTRNLFRNGLIRLSKNFKYIRQQNNTMLQILRNRIDKK